MIALAAAGLTATVEYASNTAEPGWPIFWKALIVGLGTFCAVAVFRFLSCYIASWKQLRIKSTVPAGHDGAILVEFEFRDMDIMQCQSAAITINIDRLLNNNPYTTMEDVWEERARFGRRAQTDEWLPRKSRRRALALFAAISATDDIREIKRLCNEFQRLKPLH